MTSVKTQIPTGSPYAAAIKDKYAARTGEKLTALIENAPGGGIVINADGTSYAKAVGPNIVPLIGAVQDATPETTFSNFKVHDNSENVAEDLFIDSSKAATFGYVALAPGAPVGVAPAPVAPAPGAPAPGAPAPGAPAPGAPEPGVHDSRICVLSNCDDGPK